MQLADQAGLWLVVDPLSIVFCFATDSDIKVGLATLLGGDSEAVRHVVGNESARLEFFNVGTTGRLE